MNVVDVKRHQVIHKIARPEPTSKPMGVVVSPDSRRIFVANGRGNNVSVIDATSYRLLKLIGVGGRPWGIAITPDGKKIYTANGLSNDVSVIDAEKGEVLRTISVGNRPWGVVIN